MKSTSRAFSKALARPPRDARSASANKASKKPSRAVKSLREAQKDLTRGLLMKRALKLFDERGYANTTVDDIAASAGTTRTTFYQHFKSKAELTKALILEVNEILTSSDDPPLATVIEFGRPRSDPRLDHAEGKSMGANPSVRHGRASSGRA